MNIHTCLSLCHCRVLVCCAEQMKYQWHCQVHVDWKQHCVHGTGEFLLAEGSVVHPYLLQLPESFLYVGDGWEGKAPLPPSQDPLGQFPHREPQADEHQLRVGSAGELKEGAISMAYRILIQRGLGTEGQRRGCWQSSGLTSPEEAPRSEECHSESQWCDSRYSQSSGWMSPGQALGTEHRCPSPVGLDRGEDLGNQVGRVKHNADPGRQ